MDDRQIVTGRLSAGGRRDYRYILTRQNLLDGKSLVRIQLLPSTSPTDFGHVDAQTGGDLKILAGTSRVMTNGTNRRIIPSHQPPQGCDGLAHRVANRRSGVKATLEIEPKVH
jgi:hypothetical protein